MCRYVVFFRACLLLLWLLLLLLLLLLWLWLLLLLLLPHHVAVLFRLAALLFAGLVCDGLPSPARPPN
jgi:hypothetical protein